MTNVAESDRLVIRRFVLDDAPFILRLLNQAGFLRYIGDRGVRTVEQARAYLRDGPLASYEANGFGTYLVRLAPEGRPVGMCGLMRKPWLDAPDLAYAFLSDAAGFGYASEAARAILQLAWSELGLDRVLAVVTPDNSASRNVLKKLGFRLVGPVADPRTGAELQMYLRLRGTA